MKYSLEQKDEIKSTIFRIRLKKAWTRGIGGRSKWYC